MAKQKLFHSLMEALTQIHAIKSSHAEMVRAILTDDVHSEEYNKNAARQVTEAAKKQLDALRAQVDELLPDLAATVEQERERLDLSDVRLQNAIALASANGSSRIDAAAQDSIVAPFLRNREALGALLPLLDKSGMKFAAETAEHAVRDLDRVSCFLDTISDTVYYATLSVDNAWNARGIMSDAQEFANMHGLTMPGSEPETGAEV